MGKFTDEEIKRMKENIRKCHRMANHLFVPDASDLEALLARLEAAERVVQAVGKVRDLNWKHHWQQHNKEIEDGWLAWRDVAGK